MTFKGRPIYQYQPVRETPDTPVGLLLPLNKASDAYSDALNAISGSAASIGQLYNAGSSGGASVFAQSYSTEEQAISNLINLLLTWKGERYMQPNFGTIIRKAVFEQNVEGFADTLRESLMEDVEYWLPYIDVSDIIITRHPDEYQIMISFHFQVGSQGANLVINILADENAVVLTDISQIEPKSLALQQVSSFGY